MAVLQPLGRPLDHNQVNDIEDIHTTRTRAAQSKTLSDSSQESEPSLSAASGHDDDNSSDNYRSPDEAPQATLPRRSLLLQRMVYVIE